MKNITESDFKSVLTKIDRYFRAKKIGSQGDEFIAQGTLLSGSSINDIKRMLKKEPYSIKFQSIGEDLQLRAKYNKPIVIKFPKIPRINLILFILTIFTTLLAGAIMAFTRSLGETGASLAVVKNANTVPVYIVNLVRTGSYYSAALASIVLIIISFIAMIAMRHITRRAE